MPIIGATELQPVNILGQYVQGLEAGRAAKAGRMQEASNALLMQALQSGASEDELMRMPGGAAVVEQLAKARKERAGASTADIERRMKAANFVAQSAGAFLSDPASLSKDRLAPWVSELAQNGLISQDAAAHFQQMPDDPAKLAQGLQELRMAGLDTKSQLEQQFTSQNLGGSTRLIATPKFGGGPARVVQGSVAQVTMTPSEAARVGLERQRVGLEGRRVALAEERVRQGAPETAGPTAISPKTREKREAAFPKAQASFNTATNDINTLIKDLTTLRNHRGLASITGGIEGRMPSVREKATGAQALLDKILAKGQFRSLQQLRDNSPTGGAVGNVSDAEGKALRDSFGALSQTQGLEDFQRQIDSVISDLRFAEQNIRSAFDEEYAYRTNPSAKTPSSVFDEADRILRGE